MRRDGLRQEDDNVKDYECQQYNGYDLANGRKALTTEEQRLDSAESTGAYRDNERSDQKSR